jgi:anhydro-N-acetylmuramic acid kinase
MALYVGLISGTSMDGIDAALVDIDAARTAVLATRVGEYPQALRTELAELVADSAHTSLDVVGSLDSQIGEVFAAAALDLLHAAGTKVDAVRAIGSHGQTVRHRPEARPSFSMQLGDPNRIAEITGITTVADFRRRDLAAGGEGAPLVPVFHNLVLRSANEDRAVANIGGIANLTLLLGDEPVRGFDTGPGNCLMDLWVERHRRATYDAGGAWAASGRVIEPLLQSMLADPYFDRPLPKSTGREHFNIDWIEAQLTRHGESPAPADVQATLCELTARSIAHALTRFAPRCRQLFVCGGGVHNEDLLRRLRALVGARPVTSTAAAGIDPDFVEATAFAWLAYRAVNELSGNDIAVTGARHAVILGGIYAGRTG